MKKDVFRENQVNEAAREHEAKGGGLNTPAKVANEMVREARAWQGKNPDKDVLEVITPDWRDHVRANL